MNFLSLFGKAKFKQLNRNLKDTLVSWDPESATEAEIAGIEEEFDKYNLEHSELVNKYNKEQSEADAIVGLYNQRLAGAEVLQANIAADPADTASAEGLNQLMNMLEEMLPDIEEEKAEATDAQEAVAESQELVDMFATKLKTARKDVSKASSRMQRAQRKEKTAEAKAERTAVLNGLRTGNSDMGSALSSMNRLAEEAEAKADAANRKSKLLGKTKVEDNAAVSAAIAKASGVTPTSEMSMADRLAALKPA